MRNVQIPSVVICALARDCGESLVLNIPKIEQLRKRFSSSAIVIVENDSKDNTKDLLFNWSKNSRGVHIISHDYNTLTIPPVSAANPYPGTSLERISKMASYRNIYVDWLENSSVKYDLVIVIDVDVRDFNENLILESIDSAPKGWGGIFANGFTDTRVFGKPIYTMYHDMYAFAERIPHQKPFFTYKELFKAKKDMNSKLAENEYLPVISAFGGIGIYQYDAIKGLKYETTENGDPYLEAVCEHVSFNSNVVKRGYRNYISRKLKVYYGSSEPLIVLRNLIPLWLFKAICFSVKFRKLKE